LGTAAGQWDRLNNIVGVAVGSMGEAFLKSSRLMEILRSVGDWMSDHMESFKGFAEAVGRSVGNVTRGAGQFAIGTAQTLFGGAGGGPEISADMVKGAIGKVLTGVEMFALGTLTAADMLGDLVNALVEMVRAVKNFIN